MRTIVIQIGNTDDKLTQAQWSAFVIAMREAILQHCQAVHFFGGSTNWERWQNCAWVIGCYPPQVPELRAAVTDARKLFNQESAAWTEGNTIFV